MTILEHLKDRDLRVASAVQAALLPLLSEMGAAHIRHIVEHIQEKAGAEWFMNSPRFMQALLTIDPAEKLPPEPELSFDPDGYPVI